MGGNFIVQRYDHMNVRRASFFTNIVINKLRDIALDK